MLRPTVLVIRDRNLPPDEGMRVRRGIGTDVTEPGVTEPGVTEPGRPKPPRPDAVKCTDSWRSPGLTGNATSSGTAALACAGMVTGREAGVVIQLAPETRSDIGPA